MSDDKKKTGKNGKREDKIVQFPSKAASMFPEEMNEDLIPDFLDYFLPTAFEFASVTAVEVMNYADEALNTIETGSLPHEYLEILFIKLRGLSITVPTPDAVMMIREIVQPQPEALADLTYLHDIIDEAIETFEELLRACDDWQEKEEEKKGKNKGEPKPLPGAFLKAHDGVYALTEVRDISEEVLMGLGELSEQLFEIDNP